MTKNPVEFVREVRAEVAKVTWPTRRETMITTSMVFIFVVIAALFFLVADKIIAFVIKTAARGCAEMAHRWYVVHAYSGFENKVADSIREQAEQKGLAEEISQVMVPTEEVVEVRRGSKVSTERKFFPGYVLVKMDLNDETWHLVKNTAEGHRLPGRRRPRQAGRRSPRPRPAGS